MKNSGPRTPPSASHPNAPKQEKQESFTFPVNSQAEEARARGFSEDAEFFGQSNRRAITEIHTEEDKESEFDVIMNTEGEDIFKPQQIKMESDAEEDDYDENSSNSEQLELQKSHSVIKPESSNKETLVS